MTGSIICFHRLSTTACSSLDLATKETKPPNPGVVAVRAALVSGCWPASEAVGDLMSEYVLPSGDMIEERGGAGTSGIRGGAELLAKNVEMKEYSADALSMNTSSKERTRASKCSFYRCVSCWSRLLEFAHMVSIVGHIRQCNRWPIDL